MSILSISFEWNELSSMDRKENVRFPSSVAQDVETAETMPIVITYPVL